VPASNTGALCDQLAQRRVSLALDRRRRDAYAQDATALIHDRISLRTRLQADVKICAGHRAEYGPNGSIRLESELPAPAIAVRSLGQPPNTAAQAQPNRP
jgi:hypothetical protein